MIHMQVLKLQTGTPEYERLTFDIKPGDCYVNTSTRYIKHIGGEVYYILGVDNSISYQNNKYRLFTVLTTGRRVNDGCDTIDVMNSDFILANCVKL